MARRNTLIEVDANAGENIKNVPSARKRLKTRREVEGNALDIARNLSSGMKEFTAKTQESFYVMNAGIGQTRGNIALIIPKERGDGEDTIIIPNSYAPLNLCGFVDRRRLETSSELRNLVTKRILFPIAESDALKLLDHPEMQKELQRVQETSRRQGMDEIQTVNLVDEGSAPSNTARSSMVKDILGDSNDSIGPLSGSSSIIETKEKSKSKTRSKIKQALAYLEDSGDALGTLETLTKLKLKERHFVYILKNTKNKDMRKWAQGKIDQA